MLITDLDTPALVVDLDRLTANVEGMAAWCRSAGLQLRPHIKTHKSAAITAMQLAAGAAKLDGPKAGPRAGSPVTPGFTAAKISEAEAILDALPPSVLSKYGPPDVLIAYPITGAVKAARLAALARRVPVLVAVDGEAHLAPIASAAVAAGVTVGVLVDVNVGFGRTGCRVDQVRQLAGRAAGMRGLKFRGLFCYPGQVREPPAAQGAVMGSIEALLAEGIRTLTADGLPPEIVSSGSTPSARQSDKTPSATEIRPGTYVFNDLGYHSLEACTLESAALTVRTTVVSTAATSGQVILDAGSKTLTSDRAPAKFDGFGRIVEHPAAVIVKLNEEHGWVDVSRCPAPPKTGDVVHVIPNHVCPVVNLHDRMYAVRGGRVEHVWPVDARGRVQ